MERSTPNLENPALIAKPQTPNPKPEDDWSAETHAGFSTSGDEFGLSHSLRELWQFRPLLLELVRRDLKLRYKNSVGGVAWSLLNPLLQVGVITLVVQKFVLNHPVASYSAYILGLMFLWNLFNVSVTDGCVSILQNASLVRKVYFPRAILPIATLLGNLFHFGIAFAFMIVYFFALGAYPSLLQIHFLLVLPVVFFMSLLCLGLSFILSYLNVFYEDVKFIVTALLPIFFYTMPVFYFVEQVQAKGLYHLYMLNPVAAFMVTYQRALLPPPRVPGVLPGSFLPSVGIPYDYFALACLVSVLTLVAGFLLFEKYKWEMVERL